MRLIIGAAIVLVAIAAVWAYRHNGQEEASPYRFAVVERGDLEATVSATGTLSAVTTVQVGTQVSGQIAEIYVDFNDRVKKGQLIARIDPTLQQQAVRDAQAGVERTQAELEQAQREYDRNQKLFERKVLTEIEFNTAKYALAVAQRQREVRAGHARSRAQEPRLHRDLRADRRRRRRAQRRRRADGRREPVGAAALSHRQRSRRRCRSSPSVDESDIGMIRDGQAVRFTVQAYPNEHFTGTVQQVRLQSTTVENVVNYTVVVAVENPDGKLLPGMTATVEFVTGSATNVLLVPNAALRVRPTEAMLAQSRAPHAASGSGDRDSRRQRRRPRQ